VVNVAFGKFVRKVPVPPRMLLGVFVMCVGVFFAVFFGERGTFCFTEQDLQNFWRLPDAWAWWLYSAITFGISAVCLTLHSRYWKRRAAGKPLPNSDVIMPILYAMPSALLGGGQMIVQSKTLSELLEIMATTDANEPGYTIPLAGWFFWVELLLVASFGMFWFFRLTQSLGMYDPLFIIPLMQANFIVWGGIAGGIFFDEFATLHKHPDVGAAAWGLYIFGLLLIIAGLYLVRPDTLDKEAAAAETYAPAPTAQMALPDSESGPTPAAEPAAEPAVEIVPVTISTPVTEISSGHGNGTVAKVVVADLSADDAGISTDVDDLSPDLSPDEPDASDRLSAGDVTSPSGAVLAELDKPQKAMQKA